jgi:hypothetical protein
MLPGAGNQPQDAARTIGAGMQLGAEPATAAAKRFGCRRAAYGTARSAVGFAGGAVQQQEPIGWQAWGSRPG